MFQKPDTALSAALVAQLQAQLTNLQTQVAALTASIAERIGDGAAFIAGDKSAAAFFGISIPTFLALMSRHKIAPVRTERGKIWRRTDLLSIKPDAVPFAPNNSAPFAHRKTPAKRRKISAK